MMNVEYLDPEDYQPEEGDRRYLVDYQAAVGRYGEIPVYGVRIPVVGDADLSGFQIAQAIAVLLHQDTGAPVWNVQICSIHQYLEEETPVTKYKSLFNSKTFYAIVAQFLVAVQPIVAEWGQTGHEFGTGDVTRFALLLATAAYGVYGRYMAKTIVVTPPGLLGRNAPNL